jgi:hypothetical protein
LLKRKRHRLRLQASNRIEKIMAAEQGGNIILKLTMAQPLLLRRAASAWPVRRASRSISRYRQRSGAQQSGSQRR